jgi:hypothetical protein
MRHWTCVPLAILICAASASAANSQTPEQINVATAAAHNICDNITIKDVHGKETQTQLKGEVEAGVKGILKNFVDVGGKGEGSISQQEFDGLSRDAAATVLQKGVDCRERIFTMLVNRLPPQPTPPIPREPRSTISPNVATDTAERAVNQMSRGSADYLDLPFCDGEKLWESDSDLRRRIARFAETGNQITLVGSLGVQHYRELMAKIPNKLVSDAERKNPYLQRFSPGDWAVDVVIRSLDNLTEFRWLVIVDWQTGLVKGMITIPRYY